jgi:hypothetical protein
LIINYITFTLIEQVIMSLVKADIVNSEEDRIYVLLTKEDSKMAGVYTDVSLAIKCLYLADEASLVKVSRVNHKPNPCINDTYDSLVGTFFFEDDDLIYLRNLTGEKQTIDENTLLSTEHFEEVKKELEQVKHDLEPINDYNHKASDVVDKSIIREFNNLSKLLINKLTPKIQYFNDEYDMEFDFDLIHKSNRLYQQASEKIDSLTIEEKVDILRDIRKLISRGEDEIVAVRQLAEEFDEELPDSDSSEDTDYFEWDPRFMDNIDQLEDMFGWSNSDEQEEPDLFEKKTVKRKKRSSNKTVSFNLDQNEYR